MTKILTHLSVVVAFFYFFTIGNVNAQKTVESVIITQVDTFALKAMLAQPVLKINIRVTGTGGSLSLQQLTINTSNEDNSDVDSVAVYYTLNKNRFSFADYPGEAFLLDRRKKIIGDSVKFNDLSHFLETGDNYFWVTMDLNKFSRASRYIDAYIKAGGIKINNDFFPVTLVNPDSAAFIMDIYYKENFEYKTLQNEPVGWTQDLILPSTARWKNNNGGFGTAPLYIGRPSSAKSGYYNVMLQKQDYSPHKTFLVSKKLDLSLSTRPLLSFYHSQVGWCKDAECNVVDNDELRVFYRIGENGTWNQIPNGIYTLATPNNWLKRELFFPEGTSLNNVYLGFEGTTYYGWGVCIDSLTIYETDIIPRGLYNVLVLNKNQEMVPQSSDQNPILRINLRIKGNTGTIRLNSLKVTSKNTTDNDIKLNGVKLYYTNDSLFLDPVQWGTAQSFSGGTVTFSGLNRIIETGNNYVWVTYDVKASAVPGNILDAKINAGDIGLSVSGTYPQVDMDPFGHRIVKQTLYYEGFEGTPPWSLTGEFEINAPMGKGGSMGQPDPTIAFSGTKILGTDLTGLGVHKGDYEPDISSDSAYTATSPLIDGKYFKNLQLQFYRYLNIDNLDTAWIEYKYENSTNWEPIWFSEKKYIENEWSKSEYSNLKYLDRKKFQIRFRLGSTDAIDNYSGWNIDELYFTGDSIPFDAEVSAFIGPESTCGLTSTEHIKVRIKNAGPKPLVNLPLKLSIDGGESFITEIVTGSIAVNDSIDYVFTSGVDLSKPSIYDIIVKAAHPGDNFPDNDSIATKLVSYPTYNLPHFTNFEKDTTFWFEGGLNSSWNVWFPNGIEINQPYSGLRCWKTDDIGVYNYFENSYSESPCYNFNGTEVPILDVKINHYTLSNKDGCLLEYSLDKGKTWKYLPKDNLGFPWYWYNDSVLSLKRRGWAGRTENINGNLEWRTARVILPSEVLNNEFVKFRFIFKVDSSTISKADGFAFDDFKLYDAPFDVGITTITGLSDPACQYANSPYLNVVVKNFGERRMAPGDSIIIGASVNGQLQAVDTLRLTNYFNKNATINYTLKKPVDFSETGKYTIKAFTMIEPDGLFYGIANNDTASVTLTVYQNPITTLPDTIFSARIDTVNLVTLDSANYTYYWQGSATPGTHIYTNVTDTGKYYLRVVNKISFCETLDTVFVKALIPDIAVKQILSPTNHCGYITNVNPIIVIKNEGTDTLKTSTTIPVRIKLDNAPALNENVILPRVLAPDSLYTVTLSNSIDLSAIKFYTLKVYSQMPYDTVKTNDTATSVFQIYGYPTLDLGETKVTVSDTMYRIVAPEGFVTYLWNNDSTTRFNTVKSPGWYILNVRDMNMCPATDSVFVYLKIRDIKPHRLVSPVTTCINTELSDITLRMLNAGTDTIKTNDSIFFTYRLNGGVAVTDTLKSLSIILPGDSIDYTFKNQEDLIAKGTYNFKAKVFSKTTPDFYPANDSVNFEVKVYGLPTPHFGGTETVLALELPMDPGNYKSYLWQDGSTDSVWMITQTHFMPDFRYRVTVTDSNNCVATSAWYLRRLVITDIAPSQVNMVTSSCKLTDKEQVKIKVKNVGNTPIQAGKVFLLKYKINNGEFSKTDTITLTSTFDSNVELNHTFSQFADLSQPQNYRIKVYVDYDQDINLANDTLTHLITVHSTPVIDFGAPNDTLVVDCPYTLDAGPGFISYLWSNSQFTQTISANPGNYTVTVVDANSCYGSKSVTIIEKLFDLGITGFATPLTNCGLTNTETIGVLVKNTGSMPLSDQAFNVRYVLNGVIDENQDFAFTGKPGDEVMFNFTKKENLSAVNIYNFNLTLTYSGDEVSTNNIRLYNVNVTGYPVVDFGATDDTIRTSQFPYILDAGFGFSSYLWQDSSTNQTIIVPEEGLYTVTVTNSNGCAGSRWVYIKSLLSVGKLSSSADLKIFPNPATNVLWVQLNMKFNSDAMLELLSPDGRVVLNRKLKGFKQYLESIDVAHLPRGMYYIRIYNNNWLVTDKILVK